MDVKQLSIPLHLEGSTTQTNKLIYISYNIANAFTNFSSIT